MEPEIIQLNVQRLGTEKISLQAKLIGLSEHVCRLVVFGRWVVRSVTSTIMASISVSALYEWLARSHRQPLPHQAGKSIGGTGGNYDDDAHRPRRIGLRPSGPREGGKRRSTRCQMQERSMGK
jgi:hypothetical protein